MAPFSVTMALRFFLCGSLTLVIMAACASVSADVFNMPAGMRSLDTVVVGDPGNAVDDNGRGAVPYPFKIGKFEVTAAQYAEFLNAKGKAEPDGALWFNDMDPAQGEGTRCGIRREGEEGSFQHHVHPDYFNRPVVYVSFWDACRFCNWLHNGQGDGDTETGAYTLNKYAGADGRKIRRNPGAKWFIPNEDEWYKAAYYDPSKPGGAGYWDYPTRSDTRPSREFSGRNAANIYEGGLLDAQRRFTEVAAFAQSPSGYGTFDQAGNAVEWTEGLDPPFLRRLWGGAFGTADGGLNRPAENLSISSRSDSGYVGFRIAGAVPGVTIPPAADTVTTTPRATNDFPRRPWRHPETGKPFFPMGWFVYDSDEADLDEMAKDGANVVLYVNSYSNLDSDEELRTNIVKMRQYLDHAHKRDMKVQIQLASWYGAHGRKDQAEIGRQEEWVKAICTHPALLGYQLYDEPEYHSGGGLGVEEQKNLAEFVDAMQQNRDAIRKWDPNPRHMCQVVFNLVPLSSWTAYLPGIDSFQVDRYPCDAKQAFFGHRGEWGPLMMAWSMAHGAQAMKTFPHLHNPSPCMQGVGWNHTETNILGLWRDPLYEETRYMAYSSLTVGSWGIFHWIRNMGGMVNSPTIMRNVGRLHAELRQLLPAFETSYETPPFTVSHNHDRITRDFLTDCVNDVTTLELEDQQNYYLIAVDNSGHLKEVAFRMKLPNMQGTASRPATVLNEDWRRELTHDAATNEWVLMKHPMNFGDVNIWVIPKAEPTAAQ